MKPLRPIRTWPLLSGFVIVVFLLYLGSTAHQFRDAIAFHFYYNLMDSIPVVVSDPVAVSELASSLILKPAKPRCGIYTQEVHVVTPMQVYRLGICHCGLTILAEEGDQHFEMPPEFYRIFLGYRDSLRLRQPAADVRITHSGLIE